MTRQPGLFDVDERLRRLSDIGDQLEAFAAVVDFEMFRPELEAALRYGDGAKGGRPPFDPVMMFKILVIQAQDNLTTTAPSSSSTTGSRSCAFSGSG
jgi:transposase, IS5 family